MLSNKPNVLVMEEQRIIGFDLQVRFQKEGFAVISESNIKNLPSFKDDNTPFLIIACISLLKKLSGQPFNISFEECADNNDPYLNTDTLVFTADMNVLKKFSKPFNSYEIVNFVNEYLAGPAAGN